MDAAVLMAKKGHDADIGYTNDDDGLHIWCSCGEDIPMGHDYGLDTIIATYNKHVEEKQ